jgi:hypothetical protein
MEVTYARARPIAVTTAASEISLAMLGGRLAGCVIDQRVSARRITFADLVRGYEVHTGLAYEAVCMLATGGHALQLAVGEHAVDYITALVPPHAVTSCPGT